MRFKGRQYYWLTQLAVFVLFSIIAPNVLALSLMIGGSEIKGMLALTFPYQTCMGNTLIHPMRT